MTTNGSAPNGIPVDQNRVIGKLMEQNSRLTFELAMTQAALEDAMERLNEFTGPKSEIPGEVQSGNDDSMDRRNAYNAEVS